jgi:hypothetical protein
MGESPGVIHFGAMVKRNLENRFLLPNESPFRCPVKSRRLRLID